jgi:hypothetical protein
LANKLFGFYAETHTAYPAGSPNVPASYTSLKDAAAFVVAVLSKLEISKNQHVRVCSFTASVSEIVSKLQQITRENWTIIPVAKAQLLQSGVPEIEADFRVFLCDGRGILNNLWNGFFPEVAPTDLDAAVRREYVYLAASNCMVDLV